MRHTACEHCKQSRPMSEMFLVFGRSLCEKCADVDLAQRKQKKIPEGSVRRQTDPTICSGCGRDNGSSALPTLGGGLPVCPVCDRKFRNQPFPGWIKAALTGLLLLAAFSCVYNWRFFQAYVEIQQGVRSAEAQDFKSAALSLDSASRRVPESKEVGGVASFYRGLDLLSQGKSAEALPHLQQALQVMPGNRTTQDLILRAELGVAFDRRDYDQFLAKSKIAMNRSPRDPVAVASVASALACKWAVTGEQSFKQEAVNYLEQAKRLAGAENASLKEYEARILYRLDSREIISREEYQRRFPAGYVRKGETQ